MPSYDLIAHRERTSEAPAPMGVDRRPTEAVQLNLTLERLYVQMQTQWAQNAQTLSAFFHNAQFTQDQIDALAARGQAAVPVNVLFSATEQAVSMLTTNKPRFAATAREDSDVKTAKVITDLLAWVWEISDGNAHLKRAVYDYYIKGRGVLMAYVDNNADFGRGEVKITDIDPLDVFPDPNSKDRLWRDAAHIIVSRILSREQIEMMWPDAREILAVASQAEPTNLVVDGMVRQEHQFVGPLTVLDPYHERYRVIERYTKVKIPYIHALDRTTGQERVFLEGEYQQYLAQPAMMVEMVSDPVGGGGPQVVTGGSELGRLIEVYERLARPLQEGSPTRYYQEPPQGIDPETGEVIQSPVYALTLITIADVVEMGLIVPRRVLLDRIQLVISIGDQEYFNGYLPISEYPIVPLNNLHDRNPYPMSDIGVVKPLQESLNKLHAQIIANLSSGNNQKLVVPRGAIDRRQVEMELAKTGTAVIEVDYEIGQPLILGPQQLPAGLFVHYQNLKHSIEQALGIFSLQQGDSANAPMTYKGTLALDEFGQRRIRSKLGDIEQMLNQLGRVAIQLMQTVYTEEKVIRLVQPNNIVRESVANQLVYDDFGQVIDRLNDITIGTYDVTVVSGSTLPSNRWALEDYYNELYAQGIIDQVERLKKSELIDAEGVLERSGYIAQLENAVQQLQEEVKKLKGDLQTAERAEVNSRKRLEVEKFKTQLNTAGMQAQAARTLYEARLEDDLKNRRQALRQGESK